MVAESALDQRPRAEGEGGEHARAHATDTRAERPDEFRYVLELILDGIASGA